LDRAHTLLTLSTLAAAAATLAGELGAPAALAAVAAAIAAVNLAALSGYLARRPYHVVAAVSAALALYTAVAGPSPLARTLASAALLAVLAWAWGGEAPGGPAPVAFAVAASAAASTILGVAEYGFTVVLPVAEYLYAAPIPVARERVAAQAPLVASPLLPSHEPILVGYVVVAYTLKALSGDPRLASYLVAVDASLRPYAALVVMV